MSRCLILMLAAWLAGCLAIGKHEAPTVVAPAPRSAGVQHSAPIDRQLTVALPTAAAMLDGRRVVARRAHNALSYLAGVAWPDAATRLLQDQVLAGLQDAGRLRAVERHGFGMHGDILLNLGLRRFEADYSGGEADAPAGRVDVQAILIDTLSGRAVGSRAFVCQHNAKARDAQAATRAVAAALAVCSAQVSDWVLTTAAVAETRAETRD